jgi:hypothetical protein
MLRLRVMRHIPRSRFSRSEPAGSQRPRVTAQALHVTMPSVASWWRTLVISEDVGGPAPPGQLLWPHSGRSRPWFTLAVVASGMSGWQSHRDRRRRGAMVVTTMGILMNQARAARRSAIGPVA